MALLAGGDIAGAQTALRKIEVEAPKQAQKRAPAAKKQAAHRPVPRAPAPAPAPAPPSPGEQVVSKTQNFDRTRDEVILPKGGASTYTGATTLYSGSTLNIGSNLAGATNTGSVNAGSSLIMNGGTVNLREVIELARLGRIQTIEDRYPLNRVADAYRDFVAGKIRGRAVCIPDGASA